MHKLLWATLIVLFTAALAVCQSPQPESSTDANKAVVKRAFAAFNDGDLKTLNELFDPEGPWHLPNGKTHSPRRAIYRVGQVLPHVRCA